MFDPSRPSTNWWRECFNEDYLAGHTHLDEARSREESQSVVELLELSPDDLVLDICCGQGRHHASLAASGVRIVGVDYAKAMADTASEAARKAVSIPMPRYIQGDARNLPVQPVFDAAICLFNSFGFFGVVTHDLQVLKQVHDALKPGGRFLLEVTNRDVMILYPLVRNWREIEGGFKLEETVMNWSTNVAITRHILVRNGEPPREQRHDLRLYTLADLTSMFAIANLRIIAIYNGLSGQAWQSMSPNITLVAQRVT